MARSLLRYLVTALSISSACSRVVDAADEAGWLQQLLPAASGRHGKPPNIVFILTDDQDLHMNSLDYMPYVKRHLIDKGIIYRKHYCTIGLCCPSRVSLFTGKAAHNTNVTDVHPPYGGYPKFVSQGFNDDWLPLWMQDAGYNTYYAGKLLNAHSLTNYDKPFVKGFTSSDIMIDPFTYQYMNTTFVRDHNKPINHAGEYSTDVLAAKSFAYLDEAVVEDKPFFLTIATNAPHSNVNFDIDLDTGVTIPSSLRYSAPISAKRHEHLFKDEKIPRTPAFNPDNPHGVSWIRDLPKQNESNVEANDHFYRQRLRALQAVDELVDGVFERLEKHGILENTYIFYTTDNGYHIGQHRLQPGKECGFEEDINIPLLVRGPGMDKGKVTNMVTSHTDLAPTFLSLAGGKIRSDFDGSAIDLFPFADAGRAVSSPRTEHVNIEFWGFAIAENSGWQIWNNTYKGLRLIGDEYSFYYSVWCNGEHELYDLTHDQYQTTNLYTTLNHSTVYRVGQPLGQIGPDSMTLKPTTLSKLLARLDTLVMVLKTCKARTCTHPWEALHPLGDVKDLKDALDLKYDDFYEVEQVRVQYNRCEQGQILDAEGPMDYRAYMPNGGKHWAELV